MKYLLMRFLSHHGSEPICTINDIGVYGKQTLPIFRRPISRSRKSRDCFGGNGLKSRFSPGG